MINIPLVLAGAGGAYLFWKWYRSATQEWVGDGAGNPPGTGYDDEGNATPPPGPGLPGDTFDPNRGEWGNWGESGSGIFWNWSPEMWRDAFTKPAAEDGGLRADPRSDIMDSARFAIAYGVLAMPLGAHDSHVFVYDEGSRTGNRFVQNRVIRLMVCEEPIVCRMVTRPGLHNRDSYNAPLMQWAGDTETGRGGVRCPGNAPPNRRNVYPCGNLLSWIARGQVASLEILDRPMMQNWGPGSTGIAKRKWDSPEQAERWPWLTGDDPEYDMLRPSSGLPEWAEERRKNCSHWMNSGNPGYPHLIYDPMTDGCRAMTDEERAVHDAATDVFEQEATDAATARDVAAEANCQLLYGMSCAEQTRWAHPTPEMVQSEYEARALALKERMTGQWSFISDLPPEAQPRLAQLVSRGWADGGEIAEARRARGKAIYRGLTVLMKRELQRDYASLAHIGFPVAQIAVGGPWGWAAIWQKPGPQLFAAPSKGPSGKHTVAVLPKRSL